MKKPCKKCGLISDGDRCKPCKKEYNRRYSQSNKEKKKIYRIKFYSENPEKRKEYSSRWYSKDENKIKANKSSALWYEKNKDYAKKIFLSYQMKNKQYIKERRKIYHQKHKSINVYKTALYRANKFKATPSWANKFFIEESYSLAKLRTELTGIKWHVDHIVPLKNKSVCGLHSHDNIQVITAFENISKNNRHWPNM
jgi:hypothetical protein